MQTSATSQEVVPENPLEQPAPAELRGLAWSGFEDHLDGTLTNPDERQASAPVSYQKILLMTVKSCTRSEHV